MPLLKYFVFVGSALVLLLLAMNWLLPESTAGNVQGGIERPVIRISSVQKLPERVDIDTSLPTIVPPPRVMDFSERWPLSKIAEAIPGPRPTNLTAGDGDPKKQSPVKREPVKLVKREPVKKVVAQRAASPVNSAAISNYKEQATLPIIRLSLLDILKERLERTFSN